MITSEAPPSHINMEITFSFPGATFDSMNDSLEALILRSFNFGDHLNSTLKSISFNDRESEPAILKAFSPGKLLIEGSVSFNGRRMCPFHLETKFSIKTPTIGPDKPIKTDDPRSLRFSPLKKRSLESASTGPDSPKHEAALKLQKVYKSFRTRRQLADCAVLVEQRWWKLLDFALLKLSSVSFFDIEKPESAVSRWSRARTRAAKVGKGLSKDEKAQKLALQHWLEAIDPRHRYGHNLQFYYDCWLQCESMQPFFYWLDVGEGKEVNVEQCTRSKLQQQCIKYLGPKEREAYEVIIEDGKFMYRQSRQLISTSDGPKDAKWIFVLSTSKNLYVGQKKKGTFQHSSFLAGGATSAAGQLVIENGALKAVWPHSGHYRPTEENFQEFMSFLEENNVNLTDVKKSPTGEYDELGSRLENSDSELNMDKKDTSIKLETKAVDSAHAFGGNAATDTSSSASEASEGVNISCSLTDLKLGGEEKAIGSIDMQLHCKFHKQAIAEGHEEREEEVHVEVGGVKVPHKTSPGLESEASKNSSDSEQRYIFRKRNLFAEVQEENEESSVPSELILRRINSKKCIKSYQLGKQLSLKWTTGAGPRIGCVRDYPSELQFRALEQVHLSPRTAGMSRFASPRTATCQSAATRATFLEKELQQQLQPHIKPDNVRRRSESL